MTNRVENAKDLTAEQVREIAAIVRIAIAEPCEFIPLNGCGRVYMHIGYSKIMKGYAIAKALNNVGPIRVTQRPGEKGYTFYMGCNCGEYTMKNGEFLKSDFAPSYRDQTPEDKEKWRRFAYDELRWYTDEGRHHYSNTGEHTMFMLQKFDKLESLRRKNAHKYDTKGKTHFNPVFL